MNRNRNGSTHLELIVAAVLLTATLAGITAYRQRTIVSNQMAQRASLAQSLVLNMRREIGIWPVDEITVANIEKLPADELARLARSPLGGGGERDRNAYHRQTSYAGHAMESGSDIGDQPALDLLGEAAMSIMNIYAAKTTPQRLGTTLIEMVLFITVAGALMLLTVRVLHLATQVHESGIRTTTHLRLVTSLEDRLHSDIALAKEALSPAPGQLHLVMQDASQVHYQLTKPNLVERSKLAVGSDKPVANQRWLFACNWEMNTEVDAKGNRSIVRVRLNQSTPTSGMLRSVEVSEVNRGP